MLNTLVIQNKENPHQKNHLQTSLSPNHHTFFFFFHKNIIIKKEYEKQVERNKKTALYMKLGKSLQCDTMGFAAGKPGLPEESEKLLQTKQQYPGAVIYSHSHIRERKLLL